MKRRLQVAVSLLILTAGCPSLSGRDGITGMAIRKDMREYLNQSNQCRLSPEEWEQRCIENFDEEPEDCPKDCPNADDYKGR